jgi:DNA-binding XRE family transcriptional regulator
MSVTKRIEQILEEYQLSPSRFADEIDVQRSSISHILSERNKPSLELISKILKKYPEINAEWLITGKGKMQLNLFGTSPIVEEAKPVIENKPLQNFVSEKTEKVAEVFEHIKAKTFEFENPIIKSEETIHEEISKPTAPVIEIQKPVDIPVAKTNEPTIQNSEEKIISAKINESKKIKKIVFFYDDNTFEIFNP